MKEIKIQELENIKIGSAENKAVSYTHLRAH